MVIMKDLPIILEILALTREHTQPGATHFCFGAVHTAVSCHVTSERNYELNSHPVHTSPPVQPP
jgi:hypothetical protein